MGGNMGMLMGGSMGNSIGNRGMQSPVAGQGRMNMESPMGTQMGANQKPRNRQIMDIQCSNQRSQHRDN